MAKAKKETKSEEVNVQDVAAEKGETLYKVGVNYFKDEGYAAKFAAKSKQIVEKVTK